MVDEHNEEENEEEESEEVDPAFYAHGGIVFSDPELELIGDVQNQRVLNLQPGTGEEALSLVNLGGIVTIVDDETSLEPAKELAKAAGLKVSFVAGDPNDIPAELRKGQFDLVYSGFGEIDWLTDLEGWAEGIAGALKSGGRLVIYDEHPFSYVFDADDGHLVVANSYFGEEGGVMTASHLAEAAEDDEDETDDAEEDDDDAWVTVGEDGEEDDEESDLTWTLGDLISVLGGHGIATLAMQEFETSDRFETPLDRLVDNIETEEIGFVPSAFVLLAVRLPVE